MVIAADTRKRTWVEKLFLGLLPGDELLEEPRLLDEGTASREDILSSLLIANHIVIR